MDAYNLKFFAKTADRVNPLSFPGRADTSLSRTSSFLERGRERACDYSGGPLCVPLGCHHIVPFSQLMMYWDTHIDEGHLEYSHKFLQCFARSLGSYSVKRTEFSDDAKTFCKLLLNKNIVHDDKACSPQEKDLFADMFAYILGNVFIGPLAENSPYCRVDDPGNNFENNAWVMTGNSSFSALFELNRMITEYLRLPGKGLASRIATALTNLVRQSEPYKLNPECWIYKQKHFRIRVAEKTESDWAITPRTGKKRKEQRVVSSGLRILPQRSISSGSDSSNSDSLSGSPESAAVRFSTRRKKHGLVPPSG